MNDSYIIEFQAFPSYSERLNMVDLVDYPCKLSNLLSALQVWEGLYSRWSPVILMQIETEKGHSEH